MRTARLTVAAVFAICMLGTASAAAKKPPLTLSVNGVALESEGFSGEQYVLHGAEGATLVNGADSINCPSADGYGSVVSNGKPKDLIYASIIATGVNHETCTGTLAGAPFEGYVGGEEVKLQLSSGGSAQFKKSEFYFGISLSNHIGAKQTCAYKGKTINASFGSAPGIPIVLTGVPYKFDKKETEQEIGLGGNLGNCGSALSLSETLISSSNYFVIEEEKMVEDFGLVEAG
jgi:hypothetical protein